MNDGIFGSLRVSASGLRAQRIRLDVCAENLANLDTTRAPGGQPYRPKVAVFRVAGSRPNLGPAKRSPVSFAQLLNTRAGHLDAQRDAPSLPSGEGASLEVVVRESTQPYSREYNPDHPDADEQGIVLRPNVDPIDEMMTLIKATRAYEANATALEAAKEMLNRALDI